MKLLRLLFMHSIAVLALVSIRHTALAQCQVDAGPNLTICAGQSVQIGGSPTIVLGGLGAEISWNNGLGAASNPTVSPAVTTTYTVTLTNAAGCLETDQVTVIVNPLPAAAFSIGNTGCSASPVQFTNNSTGQGLEFSWNFGNPASGAQNTSTQNNPNHLFVAPGNGTQSFNVVLTVTAANGCTNTVTQQVTVSQSPDATLTDSNIFTPFEMCGTSGQTTFNITLNNSSSTQATNTNYTLDWGDGSAPYSGSTMPPQLHTYSGTGFFDATFTVQGANGCTTTEVYELFAGSNPSVGLASPGSTINLCAPNELVFPITNWQSNSDGTTYTVTFSDGSAPVSFVHPPPTSIGHIFNTSSCGSTSIGGFPNSFHVRIIAENPCGFSAATIEPIQTSSAPSASVSVFPGTEGCASAPFTFTNASTNANFNNGGSCVSLMTADWSISPASGWTVTSGSLSNPSSFSAQFQPGEYTVTMVGANPCGSDVVTIDICVTTPPIADFTADPVQGCVPLVVPTTNMSSSLNNCDNESYVWQVFPATGWSYVSGNASSQNPVFSFNQDGTYTLQLTVTNVCGTSVVTETVTVFEPPTVILNPIPSGCEGVTFVPSAFYNTGGTPIFSYEWSFPGGTPASSTAANPGSISYNAPNNYTVSIEVENLCGTDIASQSFLIETAPVINVVPADPAVCQGSSVLLSASGASSYSWSGQPGLNTYGSASPTASPTSTTTYIVTGTSLAGCTGTAQVTVDVLPLPSLAPGGPYTLCAGDCVNLAVTASGGTAPYTNYSWTPATGLSSTSTAATNACLSTSQTYTASVTDANGCQRQTTVPVTVNPLPVVNAGANLTLCDQPVAEQLSGFSPLGGTWTGPNVSPTGVFTPSGTGSFNLTYTFVNANGCENSDQMTIDVIQPVVVDAGMDESFCAGIGVQQLTATTPGGTWSGANVTPAGGFTPQAPGIYTLTYSVGGGSCLTQDVIDVEVYEVPTPNAGLDEVICQGDAVQLSGSVSGGELPYAQVAWIAAPGLTDTGVLNPLVTPMNDQTYTLTVTDANGCQGQDAVFVDVLAAPVVNAGNDLTLCDQPIPEVLVGFSPAGGTWSGLNVSAGGTFTPSGEGVFTLTYTFTNAGGCSSEGSIDITVTNPQTASAGDDFALCLNAAAVPLTAGGTWTGTNVTPGGVFTPATAGVFDLVFSIGTGTCETSDDVQVTVYELPTVDAGADAATCDGGSIDLLATAASANGSIAAYSWSSFAGVLGTDAALTVVPASLTMYTVSVTDNVGCLASDNVNVDIAPLPVVNAGADLTLCDQLIEEVLTGFSPVTGASGTGSWSGVGVTNASGDFLSPGTGVYTLTYTFTDNGGCTDTDNITVTVIEPVVANAGFDQSICLNNGAYALQGFTPLNGVTWSGTGVVNASGTFDPLVSGEGSFDLTLAFGSGTCFSSDQVTVTVLPLPVIDVATDPVFCGNDGISDLGDFSPIGGQWEGTGIVDAATGSFDPSLGAGNYQLFYWYTDLNTGCADTANVVVSVSPVPNANFTVDAQGCTNAPANLQNTSTGATTYAWDFGNGGASILQNPEYTYPNEGIFDISLTVTNAFGCVDVHVESNEIVHPPQAQLELQNAEGCAPLEVGFINTSIGQYVTYQWDLDGTVSSDNEPQPVTYPQGDDIVVYDILLIATNYCGSDQTTAPVTVFPQPIASFGTDYDAFCSPWPMQINNTSVGLPDTFFWDFGNGNTSTLEQPISNTYFTGEEPTDYTIVLNIENECGADEFAYTVTVLPNTVTAFFNTNVTSGCEPLTVEFTDFSSEGTVVSYDFGDGNLSNLDDPTHVFTEPGAYMIAQFVNNGCSFDTTFAEIVVFNNPNPAFTTEEQGVCAGDPIQFINLSDEVNNVSWDFGDGNSSNVTNPSHTYSSGGTYQVTIQISSESFECPGTLTQNVTVFNNPNAGFTVPDQVGCSPFTVNFSNSTSGGSFYTWDFGNGESSVNVNPVQTFINLTSEPVLYTVTLTAENLQLCSSAANFDIIVSPTPSADFTMSSEESCFFPITLQLQNQSVFAEGFDWDFGVLGSSTTQNPLVEIPAVGSYPIALTASNAYGCSDTAFQEFTINPLPVIDFAADVTNGCQPLIVNFQNFSQGGASYQWSIGPLITSAEEDPTVVLNTPGVYDVTLQVTTAEGCIALLEVDAALVVFPLPTASFTHDPSGSTTIFESTVDFTNQSTGAFTNFWTFGDGGSSFLENPSYTYAQPGTYTIVLEVESGFSCKALATSTIVIRDQFNVYVPNAFTPDNDRVNDVFKPVIVGESLLDSYELTIFDRWGDVVFQTVDLNAAWLGNYKGGDYYVQNDAYTWQIKYKLAGNDTGEVMIGHVMVVR